MPQDTIRPEAVASFLHLSRRHLQPGPRNAERRPRWRFLVVLGSLGTSLGLPVFAAHTPRLPDNRQASAETRQATTTQPLAAIRSPSTQTPNEESKP